MPAIREFSLESERSAVTKRRLLGVLSVVAAVFAVLLVCYYGIIGLVLPPSFVLIAALSVFQRSARDLKIRRADHLQATLRMLRTLQDSDFDEACRRLDEAGHIVSSTRARLLDPRTWWHPQRMMMFDCWPFYVAITEKFSRVVRVQVTVDEEKLANS